MVSVFQARKKILEKTEIGERVLWVAFDAEFKNQVYLYGKFILTLIQGTEF